MPTLRAATRQLLLALIAIPIVRAQPVPTTAPTPAQPTTEQIPANPTWPRIPASTLKLDVQEWRPLRFRHTPSAGLLVPIPRHMHAARIDMDWIVAHAVTYSEYYPLDALLTHPNLPAAPIVHKPAADWLAEAITMFDAADVPEPAQDAPAEPEDFTLRRMWGVWQVFKLAGQTDTAAGYAIPMPSGRALDSHDILSAGILLRDEFDLREFRRRTGHQVFFCDESRFDAAGDHHRKQFEKAGVFVPYAPDDLTGRHSQRLIPDEMGP